MESVRHGRRAVKADRPQKHKGEGRESRLACRFPVILPAILTARLRRERVTIGRALQTRAPSPLQVGPANDLSDVHLAVGVKLAGRPLRAHAEHIERELYLASFLELKGDRHLV